VGLGQKQPNVLLRHILKLLDGHMHRYLIRTLISWFVAENKEF
jgi:hypothetical protein